MTIAFVQIRVVYSYLCKWKFERSDLKTQNDNLESTWIEIKDKNNKNILCGWGMHAPIKKLNYRDIKLQAKPWITAELSKIVKIKNHLFERKKKTTQK